MTEQFHAGQEIEARISYSPRLTGGTWRKAKILECEVDYYLVQFPDGTRATFDEAHIRAVTKYKDVPGTCMQQHDLYQE